MARTGKWLCVVCAFAVIASAGELQTAGKIEAVTLYRGQAMVMRTVAVEALECQA